jgi:hypothetical protein
MPSRRVSHRLQKGVSGGFRLGGGEPESLALLRTWPKDPTFHVCAGL